MKRYCTSKTIAEKYEITQFVLDNPQWKQKDICAKFGIKQSTLSTYISKTEKIKEQFSNLDCLLKKKRLRKTNFDDVDAALLIWFKQKRHAGISLNGELLKLKATEFATACGHEVGEQGITMSWINRWKYRHGISCKVMSGEGNDVDSEVVEDWVKGRLRGILEKYNQEDIFNIDESALFWKLLPCRTLAFQSEKVYGGKMSKERVTFLVGSSMAGEKLPLLVIGKFANPRSFRHVKRLPIKYEFNSKAWMNGNIFKTWIQKWDKSLRRRVALVIDNCSAHQYPKDLMNIEIFFFPPNTTPHTQPMDCGIIKNIKHFYRRRLSIKRLKAHDENIDFSFNLLDAMELLKESWDAVKTVTIVNCFRSAGFSHEEFSHTERSIDNGIMGDFNDCFVRLRDIFSLPMDVTAEMYISYDDDVEVVGQLSQSEILQQVSMTKKEELLEDENNSSDNDTEPDVTIRDALLASRIINRFLQQSSDADRNHVKMARDLERFIEDSRAESAKQTLITNYFEQIN